MFTRPCLPCFTYTKDIQLVVDFTMNVTCFPCLKSCSSHCSQIPVSNVWNFLIFLCINSLQCGGSLASFLISRTIILLQKHVWFCDVSLLGCRSTFFFYLIVNTSSILNIVIVNPIKTFTLFWFYLHVVIHAIAGVYREGLTVLWQSGHL